MFWVVVKQWGALVTLLMALGGGFFAWGHTAEKVSTLEKQQSKIQKIQEVDHEVLIEIRTRQEFLVEKVDDVGQDVKEILRRGNGNGGR